MCPPAMALFREANFFRIDHPFMNGLAPHIHQKRTRHRGGEIKIQSRAGRFPIIADYSGLFRDRFITLQVGQALNDREVFLLK